MKIIFVLLISLNLVACISIHKNFTLFKEQPFLRNDFNLKLNGIYYAKQSSVEKYYLNLMYLYSDGSIFYASGISEKEFWNKPEKYIESLQNKFESISPDNDNSLKERWGHFIVRNDSIYIQRFIYNDQYWMKRNSEEFMGVITNDSTIRISAEKCNWCNSQYPAKWKGKTEIEYEVPIEYGFYQTNFKPDSTWAWFRSKDWYKEGLKERNNRAE